VLLKAILFASALCLAAVDASAQPARPNTWTARSNTGRTLGGTWTAVADPTRGTATGTWTLVEQTGKTVARGGWSAAKSRTGWSGSWRAVVAGSKAEHSGTWSASVDLKADAPFGELFETAVQAAIGGGWRYAGQSGTWSIRAFK
jgi:hypothetical protein